MGAFRDKVYERVGEAWEADPFSFWAQVTVTAADRAESKATEPEAVNRWLIKEAQYACVKYGKVVPRFESPDLLVVKASSQADFR